MVAGMTGIVEFMTDLGFEYSLISTVMEVLDEGREDVAGARKMDPVAHLSFGDVQEGLDLATHTQKARETVRDALEDMITGLISYRDGLSTLVSWSGQAEDDTVTSIKKIEQGEACVVKPTFSAPSQCTPPTSEG